MDLSVEASPDLFGVPCTPLGDTCTTRMHLWLPVNFGFALTHSRSKASSGPIRRPGYSSTFDDVFGGRFRSVGTATNEE